MPRGREPRKPKGVIVEVKPEEAHALDRLIEGMMPIAKKNNPLDKLMIRVAEAETLQHDPYQRCENCKGRGWIEETEDPE